MKIHFIGIGGIGVSALARYYLNQGAKVTGSDLAESEITQALKKIGAKIHIGAHRAANVGPDTDLVVFSPAVLPSNPEMKRAKKLCLRCQSYPEALGELTRKYWTIAIAGTHGKGTTTSMVTLILLAAKLDPTVIVGTKLKEFNDSNFRAGKSKYLIIEADEFADSFLNYWPQIIVLTTIDKDHLDWFKNLGNIVKTFQKFVNQLPVKGVLIRNGRDVQSRKLKTRLAQIKNYSTQQAEAEGLRKIMRIPGEHIVADALAALTLARSLGIPDKTSFRALARYRGAWRRFDEKTIRRKEGNHRLVSDYAHHPTEIRFTLKAIRQKYPRKRIWCVFQPHQYQRTYYLFKEFVRVLKESPVDKLILADIYSVAGRESRTIKAKVSSQKLAKAVNKPFVEQMATIPAIKKYLYRNRREFDVLVVMGAGDIYNLVKLLDN